MIRAMHDEPTFADLFLKFPLTYSMRTQADLVDQLFNCSERRLAQILLSMAEFGKPGGPETFIPPITQETLAEMIGTISTATMRPGVGDQIQVFGKRIKHTHEIVAAIVVLEPKHEHLDGKAVIERAVATACFPLWSGRFQLRKSSS
jgi:hypothetical protein